MITVVIPTLNSAQTLAGTFASLVTPTVNGLVREVIVTDGGSVDETAAMAQAAGATFVSGQKGRGQQLGRGAAKAKGPWLLFLHSDTELSPGWENEVGPLLDGVTSGRQRRGVPKDGKFAAAFRFQLADLTPGARILERIVALRCAVLRLPYGDQGLLISKDFYDELGGFGEMAIMEDVDLVRRVGRGRMVMLNAAAVTSAVRYQQRGKFIRIMRNFLVMSLWLLRVPPHILVRIYG